MASLANCIKRLGIDKDRAEALLARHQEYVTEGVKPEDAYTRVADDMLSGAQSRRQSVIQQIHDAIPETDRGAAFPDYPKPPEPPAPEPQPEDFGTTTQEAVNAAEAKLTENRAMLADRQKNLADMKAMQKQATSAAQKQSIQVGIDAMEKHAVPAAQKWVEAAQAEFDLLKKMKIETPNPQTLPGEPVMPERMEPAVSPAKQPTVKEPWEMTKGEYYATKAGEIAPINNPYGVVLTGEKTPGYVWHGTSGEGVLGILRDGEIRPKVSRGDKLGQSVVSMSQFPKAADDMGLISLKIKDRGYPNRPEASRSVGRDDYVDGFEVASDKSIPISDIEGAKITFGAKESLSWRDPLTGNTLGEYKKLLEDHGIPVEVEQIKTHRQQVEQALASGKPVPSSVLADYPDLKPAVSPQGAIKPVGFEGRYDTQKAPNLLGSNLAHAKRELAWYQASMEKAEHLSNPESVKILKQRLEQSAAEVKQLQEQFDAQKALAEEKFSQEMNKPADQPLAVGAGEPTELSNMAREANDLAARRDKAITATERAAIDSKLEKLKNDINARTGDGSLMDDGGSISLGALGDPDTFYQLGKTLYSGANGVLNYSKRVLSVFQKNPDLRNPLGSMAETHKIVTYDGAAIKRRLAEGVKEVDPTGANWEAMLHAAQQGKGSAWWDKLTDPQKQYIEKVMWPVADHWEGWAADLGLIEKPASRGGGHYIFQNWMNPETGKPYPSRYGRMSKSSPQLREKTYGTYEEGMQAGETPASQNVGELMGSGIEGVLRAGANRNMYRDMHSFEVPGSPEFTFGKSKRGMRFVETWKDIEKNGLEDRYELRKDEFLEKPIHVPTEHGLLVLQGKVGILKELAPYWDAYVAEPKLGTMSKLWMASRGMVMAGVVHPFNLAWNEVANGRLPFVNIMRGLDYLKKPDAVMDLLIREGLGKGLSYRDLGIDLNKQTFTLEKGPKWAQVGVNNSVLLPARIFSKMIFEVIHPGMKAAFARDNYMKIVDSYLKEGKTEAQAARDAVKLSDRMFSGEDYRLALLETSKAGLRLYYSAAARNFWGRWFLAPTWQKEHAVSAIEVGKSLMPDKVLTELGFNPKSPIAAKYRNYLIGALGMYTTANMLNYLWTKEKDGEGKFMWQNPTGFAFKVRLPYDNPDGTAAYVHPFKSIFEVPHWIESGYDIATGKSQQSDYGVFLSKIHPAMQAALKFAFNLDEFWQTREDPRNLAQSVADAGVQMWEPMSIRTIVNDAIYHKSSWGTVLSQMGMPVSKGPAGGPFATEINEFLKERHADDKEIRQKAVDLYLDGNVIAAYTLLAAPRDKGGLGVQDEAIKNFAMKYQNRLLYKWEQMSNADRSMFLNSLYTTTDDPAEGMKRITDFMDALAKGR